MVNDLTDVKSTLILVVDDDELDFMALKREFMKLNSPHELKHVSDGVEALAYLEDVTNRKPGLILLDLNMPRVSGLELLDHMRARTYLQCCLVFVMTTSNNDKDKLAAYKKNVAGYIVKSCDGFADVVQMIHSYVNVVELLDDICDS